METGRPVQICLFVYVWHKIMEETYTPLTILVLRSQEQKCNFCKLDKIGNMIKYMKSVINCETQEEGVPVFAVKIMNSSLSQKPSTQRI